jgi:hypothetical protein
MTTRFIVQTDWHADEETGDYVETKMYEVWEVFEKYSELVDCCMSKQQAQALALSLSAQHPK